MIDPSRYDTTGTVPRSAIIEGLRLAEEAVEGINRKFVNVKARIRTEVFLDYIIPARIEIPGRGYYEDDLIAYTALVNYGNGAKQRLMTVARIGIIYRTTGRTVTVHGGNIGGDYDDHEDIDKSCIIGVIA